MSKKNWLTRLSITLYSTFKLILHNSAAFGKLFDSFASTFILVTMKKLHFLFVALLLLSLASCKLDGDSYQRFYGKVNIDSLKVQDSAFLGDPVFIYALAGAPNGCWSGLDLFLTPYPHNDTLYVISSFGTFESYDHICPEIYVLKDSTFKFIPDTTGMFIFKSDSQSRMPKYDTLVVVPKVGS